MDRGQVHGVQIVALFTVKALVGPLGVVHDVGGQVLVVPAASVLAAYLLTGVFGVGPSASAHRLVVGQQGGEPGQRPELVQEHRLFEVPRPDIERTQELVQLAHQVSRAGGARRRFLPAQEEFRQAVAGGVVEFEELLVAGEESLMGNLLAAPVRAAPLQIDEPADRLAQ